MRTLAVMKHERQRVTVSKATDRKMSQSTQEIQVSRTRALQFHCPTLCQTSYNANGKLHGAQMASIPIEVAQGQLQTYSARYDNSMPTDLHGGSINAIEFYLTDQDDNLVDLQGSTFVATLRVFWDDPGDYWITKPTLETAPMVAGVVVLAIPSRHAHLLYVNEVFL